MGNQLEYHNQFITSFTMGRTDIYNFI